MAQATAASWLRFVSAGVRTGEGTRGGGAGADLGAGADGRGGGWMLTRGGEGGAACAGAGVGAGGAAASSGLGETLELEPEDRLLEGTEEVGTVLLGTWSVLRGEEMAPRAWEAADATEARAPATNERGAGAIPASFEASIGSVSSLGSCFER